jgi:phosphoribosyl 1,2-cyclic phosphate phosphodiesterase
MNKFNITFLGTGTSTGTPIIGCPCNVCHSRDPKDNRLRTSLHINYGEGLNFIIDTGPDLRTQLLRESLSACDFAIITHDHSDHLHGIDDLRAFTFFPTRKSLPVFSHPIHAQTIANRFDYIFKREQVFNDKNPYLGGGLPLLNLHSIEKFSHFFPQLKIDIFKLPHGSGYTTGLLFDRRFAYLIDCHEIPHSAVQELSSLNLDCLIIDCLQPDPHPSHLTIGKSFEYIKSIKPKMAYLIHMNHDISHTELETMANEQFKHPVIPSFDGLQITV